MSMNEQDGSQPTVVLVHGAFADGSSWNEVIKRLQAQGVQLTAPANPLRGIAIDSAYLASLLEQIEGPVLLVAHSYGGAVITNAATNANNVVGLVYISAFIPDEGEPLGAIASNSTDSVVFPTLISLQYPSAEGQEQTATEFVVDPEKFHEVVAFDLSVEQTNLMGATQRPLAESVFSEPNGEPAWKKLPSWAVVASGDKVVGTDVVRSMAERAGAQITEAEGSHVIMMSQPEIVTEVILTALAAVPQKEEDIPTENTPDPAAPDTIVLIHGLWVTPRSWEKWVEHYEGKGYRVLAPAYPGFEVEVEALNEDPSPIEASTIPAVVEHLEGIVGELDRAPIIMGHSFGGTFTQILLDHGYGAAGVVIDSAPSEGIRVTPVAQIRSLFPILRNPANRMKAVGFTKEQFHYAFTNTLSREDSDKVYERYHIPAPGRFVWDPVLANFTPGHQETYVDFRNEERAPLLFIAGGEDNLMPPAVNQSNVKHYRHVKSVTDYKEFPGRSHYTVGEDGWEEVADYALQWALEHAKRQAARA